MAYHCVSKKGGQDKVDLRWEITESQPPGGDPLQRSSPTGGYTRPCPTRHSSAPPRFNCIEVQPWEKEKRK